MGAPEGEDLGPGISALGSLFKLTEIHLWDDGSTVTREQSSDRAVEEGEDHDDRNDSNVVSETTENEQLNRQMGALGLPLSFNTSKQKRNGTAGKRKGMRNKITETRREILNEAVASTEPCRDENTNSSMSCCRSVGESQPSSQEFNSSRNVETKGDGLLNLTGSDTEPSAGSCLTDVVADYNHMELYDASNESTLHEASSAPFVEGRGQENMSEITEIAVNPSQTLENISGFEFGEWVVSWDSFYMRNYFYNSKTQTSTWYPPEGMEHLCDVDYCLNEKVSESTEMNSCSAIDDNFLAGATANENSEVIGLITCNDVPVSLLSDVEDCDDRFEIDGSCEDVSMDYSFANNLVYAESITCSGGYGDPAVEVDTLQGSSITKRKKKVQRTRNRKKLSNQYEAPRSQEMVEFSDVIEKYWCQRYLLFSRYDEGIKMDEEGWFSVTPEALARHHALRCGGGIIVDSFTGVGGNAIQFARTCKHVIAIDIDPERLGYAHHNANVYEVNEQIDFVNGDFFLLAPGLKANTVFLSPPWGGPDYNKVETYDIKTMLQPRDGYFLFDVAKKIAPNVVMFLPRNVDLNQLAEMSLSSTPPWALEVERNFVNGKLKAITAYFTKTEVNRHSSPLYHEKAWSTFC